MNPPAWKRSTHLALTDIAAQTMGVPQKFRRVLTLHTLEPDAWTVLQMPAHYLPFAAYIGAQATGDARRMLLKHRDPRPGYQRLAIAMHFMADCGSPFHTCLFDFRAQRHHRRYEEYVARNMQKGHRFSRALLNLSHNGIFPEYTRNLTAGAYHIAGLAHGALPLILNRIRTDPFWEKRRDIAEVTLDLLIGAVRMCGTQVHAVMQGFPDNHDVSPATGPAVPYQNPLGALPFYRTYASALLR